MKRLSMIALMAILMLSGCSESEPIVNAPDAPSDGPIMTIKLADGCSADISAQIIVDGHQVGGPQEHFKEIKIRIPKSTESIEIYWHQQSRSWVFWPPFTKDRTLTLDCPS